MYDESLVAMADLDEADFQLLFQAAPGAFLVLDPEFNMLAVSDEYLRLTMKDRDELLGRDAFEVFPDNPDDPDADGVSHVRASMERVMRTGERDEMPVQKYDIRRPAHEGGGFEERWWRPVNVPVFGPEGDLRFIIHRIEDATAEQRLLRERDEEVRAHEISRAEWERELSHLAAQLFTTLESIDEGFFMLDREWRFIYVNRRCEQLTGRSRQELLGTDLWEGFPAAENSGFRSSYERAMSERVAVSFEEYSGSIGIWCDVRAYPSPDGLAVLFRDTTDRRRNLARIREQAAAIEQAHDAIIIMDLDHRIESWNPGAEHLYGYTREEVLGRRVETLLRDDPARFEEATRSVFVDGRWAGALHQRRRDGMEVIVEGRWSLLRHEDHTPRAILAINTDVTEQKKIEMQLLQVQRLESIGRLAGGLAHNLNNVFSPILMSISLLQESVRDDQDASDVLKLIQDTTLRGSEMVQQMLAFARGVDGQRLALDPHEIVAQLRRIVQDTFPKSIRLDVRLAPDSWLLRADATQLYQVLVNLCVNARDALPAAGGTIGISSRNLRIDEAYVEVHPEAKPGDFVKLSVTDDGSGIPPELVDRIFEPFFTTKDIGSGTGLGLSSVRAIVKSHGGWIEVRSEEGKGSTFDVFLPAESTPRNR